MKHRILRFFYRIYRRMKRRFLVNPTSWQARLFFWPLERIRKMLGKPEKRTLSDGPLWKALYFQKYGLPRTGPLFQVETEKPAAKGSDDYRWPRGAVYDNSRNPRFNQKLYRYQDFKPDLKVLDLGCAGGGFVRSVLEDGYTALGLEGSDQPRCQRLAEWDTIPLHLFTADITQPFTIKDEAGQPLLFDCITAWEVLEHIPEASLATLFANIVRHLAPGGIFVASIDSYPDADPYSGAVYHVCLHERAWWEERFREAGLVPVEVVPFETADYVRVRGQGFRDWDPADGGGFHVVMTLGEKPS